MHVRFRFYGELNDFLTPAKRGVEFEHEAGITDTLKHVVESLGVPHTEIAQAMVNERPVSLNSRLHAEVRVAVFPYGEPVLLNEHRFVLDGHLGRLAAYLRMLGFDTWYDRFADDAQLASVAATERRVLLTRDVGLLKRREIGIGYCVRSDKPHDQLKEVTRRFALYSRIMPFSRCMDCNGILDAVQKNEVADLLPPHTRETKNQFSRCSSCCKIFWRGSHHARMLSWIEQLKASLPTHGDKR